MLIIRSLLVTGLVTTSLLTGTAAASDTDPTLSWSVKPQQVAGAEARPNFEFTVAPGSTVTDVLVVRNYADRALDLRVGAADGIQQPDGTLDALLPDQPSRAVGAWLTPEVEELRLEPGADAEVPFTVAVPENATPGDHIGALLTSQLTPAAAGVEIDRRLGSRVRVRVDGPLNPGVAVENLQVEHHGSAVPFADGSADVRYEIVNTGNAVVRIDPEVELTGPFGAFGTTAGPATDVSELELIPGARLELATRVDGVAPTVWTRTTVTVNGSVVPQGIALTPVQASSTVWAVPWSGIAAIVSILLLASVLHLGRKSFRLREQRRIDDAVDAALSSAGGQQPRTG